MVGDRRRFTVTLTAGDHHPATLVGSYAPNALAVIRLEPGQTVAVEIRHPDGKPATVQVKLGENPG